MRPNASVPSCANRSAFKPRDRRLSEVVAILGDEVTFASGTT